MNLRFYTFVFLVALFVGATGCLPPPEGGDATNTPTVTVTATATNTATPIPPTPTHTAVPPTATVVPTNTPVPTATPVPPTGSATGPSAGVLSCNLSGVQLKMLRPGEWGVSATVAWTVPQGGAGEQSYVKYGPGETVPAGPATFWGTACPIAAGSLVPAPAPQQPVQPTAVPSAPAPKGGGDKTAACEPAKRVADLQSAPGKPNVIEAKDSWRILNGWSNWESDKAYQADWTIIIPPNKPLVLKGGGSLWERPANCEAATRAEYDHSPISQKFSLEEARQKGYIQ